MSRISVHLLEIVHEGAYAEAHAAAGNIGAVIIPGFNGLGAPWWDNSATGLISGLTLDSRRESFALGAVEAVPNQITDVVEIIAASGGRVDSLCADGGPTRNRFLMQLQSDLANVPVLCSQAAELSALGAAHLAGLGLGWWSWDSLEKMERPREVFKPDMSEAERKSRRERWKAVLAKARTV